MKRIHFALACLLALQTSAAPITNHESGITAPPQQRRGRFGGPERGVYKARITPHWFENNTRFWYRNDLRGGAKEFIVVDAEKGKRQDAFDHQKLAAALAKAAGSDFKADRLPFSEIDFVEHGKAVRFEAAGTNWQCNLDSYACAVDVENSGAKASSPSASQADSDRNRNDGDDSEESGQRGPRRQSRSPDGKWTAFVKDRNVYVRSESDAREYQLSHDGEETNAYGHLEWAPDSLALVAWRIEPGAHKPVYLIQWAPPDGGRAELKTRSYDLPGDQLTRYEVNVFDPAAHTQIKPQVDRFEHGWEAPSLHWNHGRFAYVQVDRGHQRYRVIEVDSRTGTVRNLIDEKSKTFIWTAHTEGLNMKYVNWLEKSDEMIYASERDGWRHLYLVDTKAGAIKNQITSGEYVVRGIDRIDEDNRQVWFRASGRNQDQDPYFIQYYRINFDGTGLVALTEGDGNHTVQFSPDRKYLIDTYSRVDMAPVHELRRVSDSSCGLVSKFEEADISELKGEGWEPPEVFVAKGRDGKTDIWGIICRPRPFDPTKKYPVLESIYAGPQGSYVPKNFSGTRRFSSLTDLGFVVVQMDGMGTANRSKAFHDVCWKNLKDAGFPDRILWHKAAAAKYPWYDITRVGIYGTSAGGQNAAAAVLFHSDFYKAAVANSGCHDNRMDKASWNEQWMGYPVGPQYAECSNIEHADLLQGYLMLVVGGMDDNVPPESTFRFVDALFRANKDFDLLVVPNGNHGAGGQYGQRRLQDFFVRHLQGVDPPNRNASSS